MSTVPKADTPAPANNAKSTLLQSAPNFYVRPTAGGNASGDAHVAPGNGVPGAGAYTPPTPSAPSAGGTQSGPNMGHGATQILSGISGGGDLDHDGDTI